MPLPRQSDLAPPSRIIWVNPPTMHMLLLREAWTWEGKDKGQKELGGHGAATTRQRAFSHWSTPKVDRQVLP